MDPNERQLQSAGICHRLFYYFMRTLAAQAVKPVTLGDPLVPAILTQKPICSVPGHSPQLPQRQDVTDSHPQLSTELDEDSESLVAIYIEDETCDAVQDGSFGNRGEITVEMVGEYVAKAPKKMVSIKDEPEIMSFGSKKRKMVAERQISNLEEKERELRPLRSILKVGSNLGERSHLNVKPVKDSTSIMI